MLNIHPKLNISQQIGKIKDKGITFSKNFNETKAKEFLTENTFYYKLLAYKKNYIKKTTTNMRI